MGLEGDIGEVSEVDVVDGGKGLLNLYSLLNYVYGPW